MSRKPIGPDVVELLDAQRNAAIRRVDLEHLGLDGVALLERIARMLYAARPTDVADVDQAVKPFFNFDERAELGQVAHAAGDLASPRDTSAPVPPRDPAGPASARVRCVAARAAPRARPPRRRRRLAPVSRGAAFASTSSSRKRAPGLRRPAQAPRTRRNPPFPPRGLAHARRPEIAPEPWPRDRAAVAGAPGRCAFFSRSNFST